MRLCDVSRHKTLRAGPWASQMGRTHMTRHGSWIYSHTLPEKNGVDTDIDIELILKLILVLLVTHWYWL